MARFVAEGGPWPVEHLRTCAKCKERREFLEGLSILDGTVGAEPEDVACPDVVQIVALVDDGLSQAERRLLAEHVAGCEACALLVRELVTLVDADEAQWEVRESSSGESLPSGVEASIGALPPAFVRRAVAMLVVAVALTAVYLVPFPAIESGSEERWRGPAATLDASVQWPDGGALPMLQWQRWAGASSYRVRVWSENGEKLVEQNVSGEEPLEASLDVQGVVAGEVLLWQVDAMHTGEVLSTTGPTELRWRRP
jgi:hypothetical protein